LLQNISAAGTFAHTAISDWSSAVSSIVSAAQIAISQITDFANGVANNPVVVNTGHALAQGAVTFNDWADGTATAFEGAVNRFDGTVIQAGTSGLSEAKQALRGLEDIAANAYGGAQTAVTEFGSAVSNHLNGLIQAFGGGSPLSGFSPSALLSQQVNVHVQNLAQNTNQLGGIAGLNVLSVNQALKKSSVSATSGAQGLSEYINFSGATESLATAGFSPPAAFPGNGNSAYFEPNISVYNGVAGWTGTAVSSTVWQSSSGQSGTGSYPVNAFETTYYYYDYYYSANLSQELAYISTPTGTDYQVVSMQLSNLNQVNSSGNLPYGSVPLAGFVYLVGRLGTPNGTGALESCVYAQIGHGSALIGVIANGAQFTLATSAHTAVINSTYELVLGNPLVGSAGSSPGVYEFSLLCNGSTVVAATDTYPRSIFGSQYRLTGFGQASVHETLTTTETTYTYASSVLVSGPSTSNLGTSTSTYYPPTLSSWSAQDNAAPAAVGSGFQVCKTADPTSNTPLTGPYTTGSWTYYILPASWFDTVNFQTPDFYTPATASSPAVSLWNSATNTLTVGVSGWYAISVCLQVDTISNQQLGVGFLHNGSWSNQAANLQQWVTGAVPPLQQTYIQYLAAGHTVTPAVMFSGSPNAYIYNSDTTGQNTVFTVSLMNCGVLS